MANVLISDLAAVAGASVALVDLFEIIEISSGLSKKATATQIHGIAPTFTSVAKGVVPASGGGTLNYLRADGSWATPPTGTGTVTSVGVTSTDFSVVGSPITSSGAFTLNLNANAVTNAKAAQMATLTIKGNSTGGTADPQDLSVTAVTAMLNSFTSALKGLTPASGGGTTNFLRADGTWAVPPAASGTVTSVGISSTNLTVGGGPVTGAGTLTVAIPSNAVTNALSAQMATFTIKGNNTGGLANAADLTVAQVNAILPVFTSTLNGLVPFSGGGTTTFLRADGAWTTPAGAGTVTSVGLTGSEFNISGSPITGSGSFGLSIGNNQVANSKLATMVDATLKGNNSGITGSPIDLTVTQVTAMLNVFTTGLKGLVPASGGGTTSFLRADGSFAAPERGAPITSYSANYTGLLTDANGTLLHPIADTNNRTVTIPANASVAYPVGTMLTFVNEVNTVTIAITSDTLMLAGAGTTGSRTLAANGMATALKVTATKWMISGNGLT